jgi:hypothetical protein
MQLTQLMQLMQLMQLIQLMQPMQSMRAALELGLTMAWRVSGARSPGREVVICSVIIVSLLNDFVAAAVGLRPNKRRSAGNLAGCDAKESCGWQ